MLTQSFSRTPERRTIQEFNTSSKLESLKPVKQCVLDFNKVKPSGVAGVDEGFIKRNQTTFQMKTPKFSEIDQFENKKKRPT